MMSTASRLGHAENKMVMDAVSTLITKKTWECFTLKDFFFFG